MRAAHKDFRESSAQDEGCHFIGVRVFQELPDEIESRVIDYYRSGLPGRPTIAHLVLKELERRARHEALAPDLAKEARSLRDWVADKHPDFPTPTQKTIENQIRERFWKARNRNRAKNPTK